MAPGTGDPGPLENGQEIPAEGPRPRATRAPLGPAVAEHGAPLGPVQNKVTLIMVRRVTAMFLNSSAKKPLSSPEFEAVLSADPPPHLHSRSELTAEAWGDAGLMYSKQHIQPPFRATPPGFS
jgi:hypothetical protein